MERPAARRNGARETSAPSLRRQSIMASPALLPRDKRQCRADPNSGRQFRGIWRAEVHGIFATLILNLQHNPAVFDA
jgi:hypothetical protein